MARHPSFKAADVHTGFIPQHFDTLFPPLSVSDTILSQAAIAIVLNELKCQRNDAISKDRLIDPFVLESGFRVNHLAIRHLTLKFNDKGDPKMHYHQPNRIIYAHRFRIRRVGEKCWRFIPSPNR